MKPPVMNETTVQLKNYIIKILVFNDVFIMHFIQSFLLTQEVAMILNFVFIIAFTLYCIHLSLMHASPHNIMFSFGCSKLCINFLIFTQIVFSCNIKYSRCAYIVVFHYSSFFLVVDILS